MEKLKFTKTAVQNLPFAGKGRYWVGDTELLGLKLLVGKQVKTYYVKRKFRGKERKVVIGDAALMGLAEARKRAQSLMASLADGLDPMFSKSSQREVTLRKIMADYVEIRDIKPSTAEWYWGFLRRDFSDWLDIPLIELSEQVVVNRHRSLLNSKGDQSVNGAFRVLRTLFNHAKRRFKVNGKPVIVFNPVDVLSDNQMWRRAKRRNTHIPKSKLPDFVKAVSNLESNIVRDLLLTLVLTGLRRNECLTLLWDQIDFTSETIRLAAEETKNRQEHVLPMSPPLVQMMKMRFMESDSQWVFPGNGGSHLKEFRKSCVPVEEAIGFHFTPHDLRRTFITVAESLDISHYALKRLMNHSPSGDVTEGYIMNDPERLREPMVIIAEAILGKGFEISGGDEV